ncbi:SDR family NAD(P)-dependent oxidoreductase, partial [Paracoccus rhizosphaerae]
MVSIGRLPERRSAITGATQGIGLAIARDFASEGADLLLLDLKKRGKPHELIIIAVARRLVTISNATRR